MNRTITITIGRQSGNVITARDVQLYEKHPGVPCNFVVSAQGAGYLPQTDDEIKERRSQMKPAEIAQEEAMLAGERSKRAVELVEDWQQAKRDAEAAAAQAADAITAADKALADAVPAADAAAKEAAMLEAAAAAAAEAAAKEAQAQAAKPAAVAPAAASASPRK